MFTLRTLRLQGGKRGVSLTHGRRPLSLRYSILTHSRRRNAAFAAGQTSKASEDLIDWSAGVHSVAAGTCHAARKTKAPWIPTIKILSSRGKTYIIAIKFSIEIVYYFIHYFPILRYFSIYLFYCLLFIYLFICIVYYFTVVKYSVPVFIQTYIL